MKKLLCILLSGLILTGVVGCSGKQDQNNEQPDKQNVITEEQKPEIKEIVNKDGKIFVPDLTTTGITSTEIPLNSTEIELCGKTYTMPVKISDLTANGWELTSNNFKNEFKPKVKTSLASFSMKNRDGAYISLSEAYNNTDEVQKLEDCWITGLYVDHLDKDTTKVDVVFPGGIVKGATAGNVVAIYGDPNNSELFTEYSYNLEKQLSYNKHKDSGLSFYYSFEDNGALSYAKITANTD